MSPSRRYLAVASFVATVGQDFMPVWGRLECRL